MTSPYGSLHELPPLEAYTPSTGASALFSFAALAGRPVLVVNVASACGLTATNYKELVEARSAAARTHAMTPREGRHHSARVCC